MSDKKAKTNAELLRLADAMQDWSVATLQLHGAGMGEIEGAIENLRDAAEAYRAARAASPVTFDEMLAEQARKFAETVDWKGPDMRWTHTGSVALDRMVELYREEDEARQLAEARKEKQ